MGSASLTVLAHVPSVGSPRGSSIAPVPDALLHWFRLFVSTAHRFSDVALHFAPAAALRFAAPFYQTAPGDIGPHCLLRGADACAEKTVCNAYTLYSGGGNAARASALCVLRAGGVARY